MVGGLAGTNTLPVEVCNIGPNTLTLLKSLTTILDRGNVLLNRDATPGGIPAGVGSVLTFPAIEGFADRLLAPAECVTVTYRIGLATSAEFVFEFDVLGDIVEPPPPMAQTAGIAKGKGGNQASQSNKKKKVILRGS